MRLLRHRRLALPALGAYLVAALALPMAHLAHHKNDHVHGPGGAIIATEAAPDDFHQTFDADLAALDLTDAGHLGIASVDCDLARYTLAVCDDPAAPPHTFGDELAARSPHHHPRHSIDPGHGAGSLAHFGLALLASPPFILPPPTLLLERAPPPPVAERTGTSPPLALRARAPPLSPV